MDTASSSDSSAHAITAAQLAARLGNSDAPLILDVRKAPAFDAGERMIAGALRVAPDALAAALPTLPALSRAREVVTYCVHGHQVSQGAAQQLREAGFSARFLEGGIEHWQQDGLPVMDKSGAIVLPDTPTVPTVPTAPTAPAAK